MVKPMKKKDFVKLAKGAGREAILMQLAVFASPLPPCARTMSDTELAKALYGFYVWCRLEARHGLHV